MAQEGLWFDGKVAVGHRVDVLPSGPDLLLVEESGQSHAVAASQLVLLDCAKGQLRFGHHSLEGWRLVIEGPVDPRVAVNLPARTGSLAPAIGRGKMIVLVGLSVIVSALGALFILFPEFVGRHMPMAWERKLGSAYDMPLDWVRCSNPDGQMALDALLDRLDPKARTDGNTLELVDVGLPNAVALPGGRMLLFDSLLEEAASADAIAGIVAHEIAHVRRRHVAAAMVRQMGLGTVVALLGGGALAGNAGNLLSLRYSRSHESEADGDAIAMLRAAGIDPRPTARLFEQFASNESGEPGYSAEFLSSHPLSRGRAGLFAASYDASVSYRPALAADQFAKLRQACDGSAGG